MNKVMNLFPSQAVRAPGYGSVLTPVMQGVGAGDATAWALQELNRRIGRLTYHPESVAQLPHCGWAKPPYFANADEQAIFNDVISSGLTGSPTHGGVELSEPRFKVRLSPARAAGVAAG